MSDRWIRSLAVAVSVASHALLFVQVSGLKQPQAAISKHARMAEVRLTIVQPAPTEPVKQEETRSSEPEKPREVVQKTSPIKVAKPKPVESRQAEPQSTPPPVVAVASMQDSAMIEDLRRRYLAKVMALIEAHKFYPSAARRRRVEGDVQMQLAINADGRPCHVKSSGAADILVRAALKSLDNTPIPAPPADLALPVQLNFVIEYRLS